MRADPSRERMASALAEAGLPCVVQRVERLTGGVSNLTYRVDRDDGAPVVVRVQRTRGIFEPYNVVREARVLQALAPTTVPVPRVLAVQEQSDALATPFFVMEFIDAPHMGQIRRSERVLDVYVRTVAAIHAVDWRSAGLEFLDPPSPGPAAAQRDLERVRVRASAHGCGDDPFIVELGVWLETHLPETTALTLCQGDINVYNYLFAGETVVAVVDWEEAQIADRLSDLGLLAALSYLLGAQEPPEQIPLIARYAAVTGAGLEALPYFVLAALHKLAVVHRIWSEESGGSPWYAWEALARAVALVGAAP